LERQRSQEADSHSSKKQLADEQREMGQVRDDATQVRLELEKLEPLRECQPPLSMVKVASPTGSQRVPFAALPPVEQAVKG
jgi:hypothetical protein